MHLLTRDHCSTTPLRSNLRGTHSMKVATDAPPFRPPFFRSLEKLYSFDPYILAKMRKMSNFDPYFHQSWAKCIVSTPPTPPFFYPCSVSSQRAVRSIPIRNLTAPPPVSLCLNAPFGYKTTSDSSPQFSCNFNLILP